MRDGYHSVTVGGVDRTADIASGSIWFRIRPGLSVFTYFYNSDGELDALIETNQERLFEIQT
jgi:hypothetical protein